MHAWIDLQQYEGMAIDDALRRLLDGFRLPGEGGCPGGGWRWSRLVPPSFEGGGGQ